MAAVDAEGLVQLLRGGSTAIRPGMQEITQRFRAAEIAGEPCDLLGDYIALEPGCSSMLAVWEDHRLNQQGEDTHVILEAITTIVRYASTTPQAREAGMTLLRRVMSSYTKSLYQALGSGRQSHTKVRRGTKRHRLPPCLCPQSALARMLVAQRQLVSMPNAHLLRAPLP